MAWCSTKKKYLINQLVVQQKMLSAIFIIYKKDYFSCKKMFVPVDLMRGFSAFVSFLSEKLNIFRFWTISWTKKQIKYLTLSDGNMRPAFFINLLTYRKEISLIY